MKLEAEQQRDLAGRQREARRAQTHVDPLGMVHIHLELEPHVGAPIAALAEAEAQRLARAARVEKAEAAGEREPFERHLADAYVGLLAGSVGKGRAKRPELTVLVSHSVAKRGWKDVKPGETCKIPGVGPIAPRIAQQIASDAFLNGVFFDGKTSGTSNAGRATSPSRSGPHSSWASRPISTKSAVGTAGTTSGPNGTMFNPTWRGGRRAPPTSNPDAGPAIKRRRFRIGERENW